MAGLEVSFALGGSAVWGRQGASVLSPVPRVVP